MIDQAARVIAIVAAAGTCFGLGYYLVCLYGASRFLAERRYSPAQSPQSLPPVSILKPLKGTDPEIYESFRSHCLQDYPEYELVFGISDPDDPVISVVERLQQEFPQRQIQLVHCNNNLGANTKISNLVQMLPRARHPILIVNDSDIRVAPDYLRRVIAPLHDPKVGLTTCLYRGAAGPSLGSRLESLGISTDFCPSVLVARILEGMRFGLGSTLAFRRSDLQAIGGFEPLLDYLADDYELGARIAGRGLQVKLAETIVETSLPAYSLKQFFQHQLRWARTIRDARRWGYVGFVFTFALLWALLTVILARGEAWAWVLLIAAAALRAAVALAVGSKVLNDRNIAGRLWLIPLRDLIALVVWAASFAGHTVTWRGKLFRLKNGKLARISPEDGLALQ